MDIKELFLKQFNISYDQNGWFVALKNTLQNLTAEEAAWKPENLDNSIWQILAHLNYYNFAYLERFKGIDYVYPKADNDATFEAAEDISDEVWQAEIARFEAIMEDWRGLLEIADEAKFDEKVSASSETTWEVLLSNLIQHNSHHGGQIVVIRKLQKSWDRSKGVY
ncbi:MAG TPA: DinB family protein [Pyrinomonadaceae bacterium]|nr:DinB family protein [Pyrinomonadaceae bacterium]